MFTKEYSMELVIKDLYANVGDTQIINGLNLTIKAGEIHAIMGPNGTGKSTLAGTIMGNPRYEVTNGSITLDGEDVLEMEVDERSRKGIFLGMQYPQEIPGITNADFIKSAMQARLAEGETIPLFKFVKGLEKAVSDLKMDTNLPHRYVNEGFSGGEKKRNEILQMKMLKPKLAILDEIDSGLDVDALRIVGENINGMRNPEFSALIITHYQRLLDYIDVDYVHIMINGTIAISGGKELIQKIDTEGYDWIKSELGIEEIVEEKKRIVLGSCAVKETK